MFTVADFLKLSEIQDIRLLAGAGGVGRIISRTSFIDNPDTFDWMTPGEFVLSTGYLFPEGEDQQRRILQQMVGDWMLRISRQDQSLPERDSPLHDRGSGCT